VLDDKAKFPTMATRYQRNAAVETAPLQDHGLMVLEPESRRFCALNGTSHWIWQRLEQPASPEQLAEHVTRGFRGVTVDEALRDVQTIIQEMTSLGIVVEVE
jgi:hypothetical protein